MCAKHADRFPRSNMAEILNEDGPLEKRRKLEEESCEEVRKKSSEGDCSSEVLDTVKNNENGQKKCLLPHRSESDVGISQFVSSHEGFSGILKQRYSDFVVNEIDVDGNAVHLTNTELPETFIKEEIESAVLPPDMLQKLQDLVNNDGMKVKVNVATEDDKEQRTLIHREIRQKFPMLESDTCDIDGHKVVRAFRPDLSDNKRRRKNDWPRDRGEYCHFLLHKENKDTMQAINLLAKCLKIKADRFSYAGTKDGRAVTVQRVSVFRIDARNLLGLNKVLKNICVGNFEFKKTPLKLGDLRGNSFVVVLRNVDGSDEQIMKAMSSLKKNGFINYFGLQRFGSSKNATHHIGLCLLKSQWSEAIDLILGSRCDQDKILNKMYGHWKSTKNAKESCEIMCGKKCLETSLLEGLVKFAEKKDYIAALKFLPRNTRLMYVHAYQSFVWNVVVSRRIQELDFSPVPGDLVFESKLGDEKKVKILSAEDVDAYTIHDVVMPLPGYDVTYPQHAAQSWYKELLSQNGLDMSNMRHSVKDYSLSGTYRHVVIRPEQLKWKVLHYDDPTISLVQTDLDCINGDLEAFTSNEGKYRALCLEFQLASSCYATMLVREVLKTDTSASYHSSLNKHD